MKHVLFFAALFVCTTHAGDQQKNEIVKVILRRTPTNQNLHDSRVFRNNHPDVRFFAEIALSPFKHKEGTPFEEQCQAMEKLVKAHMYNTIESSFIGTNLDGTHIFRVTEVKKHVID